MKDGVPSHQPNCVQDSIEEINLRQNNISDLGSASFAGLQNLKLVDLRNNALRTIPRNSLKISSVSGQ